MLGRILRRWRTVRYRPRAGQLFAACVEQTRRPEFYAALGVPDTLDGRFDLLTLHVGLVLMRLRQDGNGPLAEELVDAVMRDMDGSLRETGVSDLAVPRRMRSIQRAFYGRLLRYEAALAPDPTPQQQAAAELRGAAAPPPSGALAQVAAALDCNLYGTLQVPPAAAVRAMAHYLRDCAAAFAALAPQALAQGATPPFVALPQTDSLLAGDAA